MVDGGGGAVAKRSVLAVPPLGGNARSFGKLRCYSSNVGKKAEVCSRVLENWTGPERSNSLVARVFEVLFFRAIFSFFS